MIRRRTWVAEGDAVAYHTPWGLTVLCDVVRTPGEHDFAQVQLWSELHPRWVHTRWLSPHLTPREQSLVDARRQVAPEVSAR